MSMPTSPNATSNSPSIHYPSLAALQAAHNSLLQRQRQEADAPTFLADVAGFLREGAATGALLDADADRRTAQGLLDYWVARLYRVGAEPPDATLAEFDPALAPELPDELCPYLGLDAFREADGDKFFGRAELIARLIEQLANQRLLAIVGPSGSGKSSLVRAGLIPALKRGALPGSENWIYLPPIVPGSDPLVALRRVLPNKETGRSRDTELDASGLLASQSPCLLIVDQFEELFTLCDNDQARRTFVAALREFIETPDVKHRLILTMRSDFETFIARAPDLQARFNQGRVQVTPLSAAELREAIELPAATVGLKFQAGIVDALLQDILGEPAGLPLLQFTLLKLWEQRDRNRVTHEIYEHVGGGRLALARSADEFYASLIPEEQVTARRIMLRMIRPGEGLEITSARIRRAELYSSGEDPGRVDRVLVKLIDMRLVRLTEGKTQEDTQVEVAHEALVRNWPTLVDWLEQERVALATRRRLESRAAEWVRLGQGSGGLLDEVELREAERWLESAEARYLGYEPALPTLVNASRTAIEVITQKQKVAYQRLRLLTFALIVALMVALVASIVAFGQRDDAKQETIARTTAEADARNQAATASSAQQTAIVDKIRAEAGTLSYHSRAEPDPLIRLLLAIEAAKPVREGVIVDQWGQIETSLRQALLAKGLQVSLHTSGETDMALKNRHHINSIAWSHDGTQILTTSDDQTARIWDAITGSQVFILTHPTNLHDAAWSPDKLRVAIASDKGIYIWNSMTTDGQEILLKDLSITSLAWNLDGQKLLVTSANVAYILNSKDGKILHTLSGHQGIINEVAWRPDGLTVATASSYPAPTENDPKHFDGTVWIWDATTGKKLHELKGHQSAVTSVAWSPDGKNIVTAGDDATARIWSYATGRELTSLRHSFVRQAAWSPDGRRIITAGGDEKARIWDAQTGAQQTILEGVGRVTATAWNLDGKQVVTSGDSGIALIHYTNFLDLLIQAEKATAKDKLTPEQRSQYLEGFQPTPTFIANPGPTSQADVPPMSSAPTAIPEKPTPLEPSNFSGRVFDNPTDAAVECGGSFDSRIWGVVRDREGRGIRGAQVQVQSANGKNVFRKTTNSQGGFEVGGLGCTTWRIRLTNVPIESSFRSDSVSVELNGGRYSGAGVEFRQK